MKITCVAEGRAVRVDIGTEAGVAVAIVLEPKGASQLASVLTRAAIEAGAQKPALVLAKDTPPANA